MARVVAMLLVLAAGGLTACGERPPPTGTRAAEADFQPFYYGIETRLLDTDLVGFVVEMAGARTAADIEDYARCAAAQYAVIRGYGFARHVRTRVAEEAGVWRADAVYTVSAALPDGVQRIDAEVTVADCAERGIPTV